MPKFEVTAAKKDSGETHQYIIEASNEENAAKKARSQGLFPTAVKLQSTVAQPAATKRREQSDTQILLELAKHSEKTASRLGWLLAIHVVVLVCTLISFFVSFSRLP